MNTLTTGEDCCQCGLIIEDRRERLRSLISQGVFPPTIDSLYVLDQVADAFSRQLKPGKRGKILTDFQG